MQIASWMTTLTGAMGLPRIPRNASLPGCGELWFVPFYFRFFQSVTGTTVALFNAFSFPGNALVCASVLWFYGWEYFGCWTIQLPDP